jgi:restriction system protein
MVDTLSLSDFFVGRREELTTLRNSFNRGAQVAVICGTFGTGKTALAHAFTEANRDLFPGGLHYVQGFESNSLGQVLERIIPNSATPTLLVLDEADRLSRRDFSVLRERLLKDPNLKLILTTVRHIETGFKDQVTVNLNPLSEAEMYELFKIRLGETDPEQFQRLWESINANAAYADFASRSLRENILTWSELLAGLRNFEHSGLIGPDGRPISSTSKAHTRIVQDVTHVNEEILKLIQSNPKLMWQLPSRKFEEIIGEILSKHGYEVSLTPASGDGGFDMYAAKQEGLGRFLYLVECKKYCPPNKVGVEVVRSLYGVLQNKKATAGVIVTSSFFTAGAQSFQKEVLHQMHLHDYIAIQEWLKII